MTHVDRPVEQVDKFTVAFYNTENLFDLIDDKRTYDHDLFHGNRWNRKRYQRKLKKLGFAISHIGLQETGRPPALIGLAEVENSKVLKDLINSKHLRPYNYRYVHFDSQDERGIDVALMYDPKIFEVISKESLHVELFDDDGSPDYTRDILHISGPLVGQHIHIIINHWSSRREGHKETEHKRIASSDKVAEIISSLKHADHDSRIVILGDFNDGPKSKSIHRLVTGYDLYNAIEPYHSFNRGSIRYKKQWNLFDQILLTKNFLESTQHRLVLDSANIFDPDFLKQRKGKHKGSPFRTFYGKKYRGGYSDHFPVYTVLSLTKRPDK